MSRNDSNNAGGGTYGTCAAQLGEGASADDMFRCFSENSKNELSSTKQVLLVLAAAMVFFMQAGFAMVCAGAIRKKNVSNSMLKNLLDACGSAVTFYSVGYAFSYGGTSEDSTAKTFIGSTNFFLMDTEDYAFFAYNSAFAAATVTIVAGTLAERCQMTAYLLYSVLLSGWVWPIIVHSVWSYEGFLSAFSAEPLWGVGVIDFAGSGVVHLCGGFTALLATSYLGARQGRFRDEDGIKLETPKDIPGSSIALQMLGTLVLWFGWFGFNLGPALVGEVPNAGSIAALSMVNTSLSGGTAGIVALIFNLWLVERRTGEPIFDLVSAMNGSLTGLVAVCGGCGVMEPWAALVVGCISGLLYVGGSHGLIRLELDDAVDAIPVHMGGGLWGLISVGLFASPTRMQAFYGHSDHPGWFYSLREGDSDGRLMGVQLIGIIFIVSWVAAFMFPFFAWLNYMGWLRSDALDEIVGLDMSYHRGALLPDTCDPTIHGSEVKQSAIDAFNKRRVRRLSLNASSHGDSEAGSEHV